jgi:sterol desaturase/sphingolipid hydroxylase (fatty acid hydroxylase superfamily)
MDIAFLSGHMAASSGQAMKILFPLALGAAVLEFMVLKFIKRVPYSLRESAISFTMGVGYARAAALVGLVWGWLYFWCYELRLFEFTLKNWWEPVLLFILIDFCFYWQHRFAHVTRWGWVSHLQHHSVEQLTMVSPFRLSVTSAFSGFQAFYAPLALIGFHPAAIVVFVAINVSLQVFLHTETVRKLGPLEWFLNTPSHHRVHHASNEIYLDKNLGGIFIIWDRLFETFQTERDDVRTVYGLVQPIRDDNSVRLIFRLWFAGWIAMFNDVWHAKGIKNKFLFAFGPPGWPGPANTEEPELKQKSAI